MGTSEWIGLAQSLPYLAGVILLPLIYHFLFNLVEPAKEAEALDGNTTASGVNRFGAYSGLIIAVALGPLLGGASRSYGSELLAFYVSGLITIAVFIAVHHVLDWVIVRHVDNTGLIRDGNLAVAVTEACAYIAVGLTISAAFAGEGQGFVSGTLSALLFSALGTAVLMAVYLGYCAAWRDDVDRKIGEGDLTSAIDAGSVLIAIGITLFFSIAGDFTGWLNDIVAFAIAVVTSTILVPVGRFISGKLIVIGFHDQNPINRSLLIGATTIGVGLVAGLAMFS